MKNVKQTEAIKITNFPLINQKVIFNTRSTVGVILTHSIMLFAYICKVDSNRDVKLSDFS